MFRNIISFICVLKIIKELMSLQKQFKLEKTMKFQFLLEIIF